MAAGRNGASRQKTAVVIGSGFGGLAAALRMRAKGYDTTLLERGTRLGGRAQVFEKDGFRHDAGPTVITAPFLFEELFALFDEKMEDHVKLVEVDPWYRFRFNDGDTFDYGGTIADTQNEIARFDKDDAERYLDLIAHSKKLFDAGFTELADQPFHEPGKMIAQIPKLVGLKSYKTVWGMVSSYIKNDKVRQALSVQPLLVGGSPFDTTSIYGLIHYLEREWGVFFCMGGTGAMVKALGDLYRANGGDIRFECTVDQVMIEGGVAKGVKLESGEKIFADVVISNADPMHLYRHMVPEEAQSITTKLKKKHSRMSMGLFVMFFGTRTQYHDVAHHTIWLGPRYKALLDEIFKKRVMSEDFSLYLHRPTATDQTFAPDGCDSFYVLCPVPNQLGHVNWEREGPRLRDRIVDELEATMLPDLRKTITSDFYMTPDDFAEDYLSYAGAGFSIAPHFTQSAWFRFHNKAEGIENLFLTGAGTHPGAGMPGVLCSAKVVDKLVPAAV
ncbi:MAG: phytoene desaturase family protein [Pseudomonadota bacterium]